MSGVFRVKLMLLSAVTVFALSAMTASAAVADAGQEFEKPVATIVGIMGTSSFKAGPSTVTCESGSSTATGVAGKAKTDFEKVVITFHGCKSIKPGCAAEAAIHSLGAAGPEEVVTKELTAELAENKANDKPAILFEGVGAAEVFTELEGNACTKPPETKVTGRAACEIKEVGRTTGEIICPRPPIAAVERSVGDVALLPTVTLEGKMLTVQEANKLLVGI